MIDVGDADADVGDADNGDDCRPDGRLDGRL